MDIKKDILHFFLAYFILFFYNLPDTSEITERILKLNVEASKSVSIGKSKFALFTVRF